ncbi:histone-lysine N-methyltransferase SETMAR [Plakobranchus ocellatus]|uniref:Histone-lysine N-methyltransferase SETMAR n=1 Tax=Plakobranchus ocellatus TaxID=259542 RepID=A0AAV3Y850_9GAST|nr:histone-lysine N-methyltransferase SETMAR [Plakobranchus ocellatus]
MSEKKQEKGHNSKNFDQINLKLTQIEVHSSTTSQRRIIVLKHNTPSQEPSPDLAPSDFHLFGPLKRHLGGMAFETEDDLISELRNWFDNLDVDFFRVGINSLLSRWQKCIDLHGDYVEK